MTRFTYFAHCRETGLTKIGCSANPRARVKQLRPVPVLFAVVPEDQLTEAQAHRLFSSARAMGEWFSVTKAEVIATLKLENVAFLAADRIPGVRKTRTEGGVIKGRQAITITMPEEMAARFRALAKKERRTLSAQLGVVLQEKLDRDTTPEPQPEEATV